MIKSNFTNKMCFTLLAYELFSPVSYTGTFMLIFQVNQRYRFSMQQRFPMLKKCTLNNTFLIDLFFFSRLFHAPQEQNVLAVNTSGTFDNKSLKINSLLILFLTLVFLKTVLADVLSMIHMLKLLHDVV
jgi:hypothetical protein